MATWRGRLLWEFTFYSWQLDGGSLHNFQRIHSLLPPPLIILKQWSAIFRGRRHGWSVGSPLSPSPTHAHFPYPQVNQPSTRLTQEERRRGRRKLKALLKTPYLHHKGSWIHGVAIPAHPWILTLGRNIIFWGFFMTSHK